ncbi:MAG: hypothetical protein JWR21_3225, partial [Herminiimonas sp.]|nr:hypothetical protein [Herminiimonas sp.]
LNVLVVFHLNVFVEQNVVGSKQRCDDEPDSCDRNEYHQSWFHLAISCWPASALGYGRSPASR